MISRIWTHKKDVAGLAVPRSEFREVQVHLLFVTATQNIFSLQSPLVAGVWVAAFKRVGDYAGRTAPNVIHGHLKHPVI